MKITSPIAVLAAMGVFAVSALAPEGNSATASPAMADSAAIPTAQYALQPDQYLFGDYGVPSSLTIDPTTNTLYAFDAFRVWSVSLDTGAVSSPITLNQSTGFASLFALDPAAHRLWALQGYSQLAEIDTLTWTVVATFDTGKFQGGIAADPSTHHVFLSSPNGQIEALDGASGAIVATADIGGGHLAVDPALGLLYALPAEDITTGVVTSLRTDTLAVVDSATVAPGASLGRIKVSTASHRVFVSGAQGSVSVLDGSDLSFIANGPVASYTWTPTSAGDQIASVAPYSSDPNNFLLADLGRVDVYSVATGQVTSHFTVQDTITAEADPSTDRMFFGEGIGPTAFGVVRVAVPSVPATPVYRFWSPTLQVHFYTASAEEKDGILARYPSRIWTYEGVAFSAFLTESPDTVPLFRFWSPRLGDHFYTTNSSERDSIIATYDTNTWTYEGVAFYVYPDSVLTSTLGETRPVARFWSPDLQNHFYTASTAERDQVIASYPKHVWTYEDDDFRVPTE